MSEGEWPFTSGNLQLLQRPLDFLSNFFYSVENHIGNSKANRAAFRNTFLSGNNLIFRLNSTININVSQLEPLIQDVLGDTTFSFPTICDEMCFLMESWEIWSKHFWISSSIAKQGGPNEFLLQIWNVTTFAAQPVDLKGPKPKKWLFENSSWLCSGSNYRCCKALST